MFRDERFVSQTQRGFTLIAMLVCVFIILFLTIAVPDIFATEICGQRVAKEMERNLENAQFAMRTVAKILCTSAIEETISDLRVHDFSILQTQKAA